MCWNQRRPEGVARLRRARLLLCLDAAFPPRAAGPQPLFYGSLPARVAVAPPQLIGPVVDSLRDAPLLQLAVLVSPPLGARPPRLSVFCPLRLFALPRPPPAPGVPAATPTTAPAPDGCWRRSARSPRPSRRLVTANGGSAAS